MWLNQVTFIKGGITMSDKTALNEKLTGAIHRCDQSAVRLALQDGADPNSFCPTRREPALILAAKANHFDIVVCLLQAGADPFLEDGHEKTAYQYARFKEYTEIRDILKSAMETGATSPEPPQQMQQEISTVFDGTAQTRHAVLTKYRLKSSIGRQMR